MKCAHLSIIINVAWVLTVPLNNDSPFSIFLLGAPISWNTAITILTLAQLIIRQWPLKCSSERKICTLLTLNQKLEMTKLRAKGMSKAETAWQLSLLLQIVREIVKVKKKFLKEIKSAAPVNTQVIKMQNRVIADILEVSVVWTEDQTSHKIPLNWSLIWNEALTLF